MKNIKRNAGFALLAAGLIFAAACATTRPEAPALRDARLALQDARDAGAPELAAETFNRASNDLSAAQREWNAGHESIAMHYAQIADSEARDAEYRARGARAEQALAAQKTRHDRLEAELHAAQERAIAARARSEAERQRLEAEMRAREEQARLQAEMQAREAQQRAAEDREKALQAQLEAERQRSAQQQRQAQIDDLKMQLDQQTKAAEVARQAAAEQSAKLEEARRQEEERRRAAEEAAQKQLQAQNDLVLRLQQLEKSTRVEPRGIVVTLPGSIYFATNRSDLQPGVSARLADIGKTLASAPDRHIVVEGHTDSTGRAEYNLKLSQLRAESVKAVLLANGVDPGRIETQGYGATKPVADNKTPSGRSQNRRVEIIVQGGPAPAPAPEAH
ncbi:MAG TPA: OmpA family protein [Thermoanaerobaculia bacterium]|nr:OmpA family protein [Thermoanaerobaculia bacterium]